MCKKEERLYAVNRRLPCSVVRLQAAFKTGNELVPRNGTQVILVLVVEVDSAKGAARRTHADAVAVDEFGVAEKVFAINGKSVGVLVEWLL